MVDRNVSQFLLETDLEDTTPQLRFSQFLLEVDIEPPEVSEVGAGLHGLSGLSGLGGIA